MHASGSHTFSIERVEKKKKKEEEGEGGRLGKEEEPEDGTPRRVPH